MSEEVTFEIAQEIPRDFVFEELPPQPVASPRQQPSPQVTVQRQATKPHVKGSIQPPTQNKGLESPRIALAESAKSFEAAKIAGRALPHDLEAEASLLSCCILDGGETLEKCLAAKLPTFAFCFPPNQIIYKTLCARLKESRTVAVEILADDLRENGQLDAIGGNSYLLRVSSTEPTTAKADHFLDRVRNLHLSRELIRIAATAMEKGFDRKGEAAELIQDLGEDFDAIRNAAAGVDSFDKISKSLADFRFPLNDPNVLIGPENRYLCRGGKLVIVAPSGTGKSVTAYQMAAGWSVGRPFLGLTCAGAMRSLIIQVEDDEGDIGEVNESIAQAMGFDETTKAQFRANVRIVRDDTHTGMAFVSALRSYIRAWPADLVWINPLVNFCPGMSEERVLSEFLCGLNAVNEEHAFAYCVTHHTSKPPATKDGEARQAAKSPYARQYSAFGSSILTNWARAIINLEAVANDDTGRQFRFNFDKRGRRAGIKEEGEGGHLETVTRIRARHSTREVTVGTKKFPMLLWEADEAATHAEESKRATASENGKKGGRPAKRNEEVFLRAARLKFPREETAVSWMALTVIQNEIEPISKTQMGVMVRDLVDNGLIMQRADGLYWIPPLASATPYDPPAPKETWYRHEADSPWPAEPPPGIPLE